MRHVLWIFSAALAFGQGTEPKPKPEDYDAHAGARTVAIGAEFMVHSFSRGQESFLANNYLVVEVAIYPPKGETIDLHDGQFSLRINGKKPPLPPQSPSMVAASLQHPEWEQPGPRIEAGAGAGNTGVIFGAPPRNTNPFPGSNPPGSRPPMPAPRDPGAGLPKAPPETADAVLMETALPEGPHHAAISGFLYFPYRGKISSLKTLELLYDDAVLKLR
jgi:hypothetical protein